MIKETYIGQFKKELQRNQQAKFYICVSEILDIPYETGRVERCIALSPSPELLRDYQSRSINWTEFQRKFLIQMKSPIVRELLAFILKESHERDVYFVCTCSPREGNRCHRFILLDLVNNLL
jgi:uncharacterized protein YeaO (DUF488 family)